MPDTRYSKIPLLIPILCYVPNTIFVAFTDIIILPAIVSCRHSSYAFTCTPLIPTSSSMCFLGRELFLPFILTLSQFIFVFLSVILIVGFDDIGFGRIVGRNCLSDFLVRWTRIYFTKFEFLWINIPIIVAIFLYSWIIISRRPEVMPAFPLIIQALPRKYRFLHSILPFVWESKLKFARFGLSGHLVFSIDCSSNWEPSFHHPYF